MKKGSVCSFLLVCASVITVVLVLSLQIRELLSLKRLPERSSPTSSPLAKGVIPLETSSATHSAGVSFQYVRSEGVLRRFEAGSLVGTYRLTGALPSESGTYNESLLFHLREGELCREVGALQDRKVCARAIAVLTSKDNDRLSPLIIVEADALKNPNNKNVKLIGAPQSLINGFYSQGFLQSFLLRIE